MSTALEINVLTDLSILCLAARRFDTAEEFVSKDMSLFSLNSHSGYLCSSQMSQGKLRPRDREREIERERERERKREREREREITSLYVLECCNECSGVLPVVFLLLQNMHVKTTTVILETQRQ